MQNPSLSDQDIHPDQSVVAAQQAQPLTQQNVQGSAMLDADIAAGAPQPEGAPVSDPIATNFSSTTANGDPKTAGTASEMGTFAAPTATAETGRVNVHRNPDVPRDRPDSPQGTLPDTDPMTLPIDASTNLPD